LKEENGKLKKAKLEASVGMEGVRKALISSHGSGSGNGNKNSQDLVEKLTKAIGYIEKLSQENSRLTALNNRLSRDRYKSNEASTRESSARLPTSNSLKRPESVLPQSLTRGNGTSRTEGISILDSMVAESDLWEPLGVL